LGKEVMPMLVFNDNLIEPGDRLAVAISGGIDSMVLFDLLLKLRMKRDFSLVICHVNHHTRKETEAEAEFVFQAARDNHLECEILDYHPTDKDNFHQASRQARYDFFLAAAKKHGANKIVLAHHADDLAETILMRISRGSSLAGYSGIPETGHYKDLQIIRPLLKVSRAEIETYQKEFGIKYMEDASNQDDNYTRNRFRHHLIPFLEQENPAYTNKFVQFSVYLQEAHALVLDLADSFLQGHVTQEENLLVIPCPAFNGLYKVVRREAAKLVIDRMTNDSLEVTFPQLDAILEMAASAKTHSELTLSHNLSVKKSYDRLMFCSALPEKGDYEYQIDGPGEIQLPGGARLLISTNNSNLRGKSYELWYNDLDFIFPLSVRNRRPGDRVEFPYGTKKLKDLFIEKRVPHLFRDEIPLVFDKQGNLLWIPGYYGHKATGGNKLIHLIYQKGR